MVLLTELQADAQFLLYAIQLHNKNRSCNMSSGLLEMSFNGGESEPNYHRISRIKQATGL